MSDDPLAPQEHKKLLYLYIKPSKLQRFYQGKTHTYQNIFTRHIPLDTFFPQTRQLRLRIASGRIQLNRQKDKLRLLFHCLFVGNVSRLRKVFVVVVENLHSVSYIYGAAFRKLICISSLISHTSKLKVM